jgi:hypothetical protein
MARLLNMMGEFDGDTTNILEDDTPDHEILIQDAPNESSFTVTEEDEQMSVSAPRSSGAVIRIGEMEAWGRRITHIRKNPDGTEDIIYVEG